MVSAGMKQIAWFFIFLLAGHEVAEAARVRKHKASSQPSPGIKRHDSMHHPPEHAQSVGTSPLPSSDKEVEKLWRAENRKCTSEHLFWCAEGPTNPNNESVHRCKKQPLAGDVRTEYKCRVADQWMLEGTPEKPTSWWLTMQIKLLKAKTHKLTKHCTGSESYVSPKHWYKYPSSMLKCTRASQHVLRSLRFIAKASKSGTLASLTPEQVVEAQDAAKATMDIIVEAMVPTPQKKQQVIRFIEAVKKDEHSFAQNPEAAIARILKVIQEDIVPVDADPAVAEEEIQKVEREAKPAELGDAEVVKAHAAAHEDNQIDDQLIDDAFQAVEDGERGEEIPVGEEAPAIGNTTALVGNGTALVHLQKAGIRLGWTKKASKKASKGAYLAGLGKEVLWFILQGIIGIIILPFVIVAALVALPFVILGAFIYGLVCALLTDPFYLVTGYSLLEHKSIPPQATLDTSARHQHQLQLA